MKNWQNITGSKFMKNNNADMIQEAYFVAQSFETH